MSEKRGEPPHPALRCGEAMTPPGHRSVGELSPEERAMHVASRCRSTYQVTSPKNYADAPI